MTNLKNKKILLMKFF